MPLRFLLPFVFATFAGAQTGPDVQKLLDRLDRLEQQNKQLNDEVQSLRAELTALKTTAEKTDVQEARIDEQAQTKVEASQKFPVQFTGMLLFNSFLNGKYGGTLQDPLTAAVNPGVRNSGASFRQTTLGFKFDGPELAGGGKASGNIFMDFFGGVQEPNGQLLRLRVATLDLAWKNTTVTVGQDKPIFAPREPTSLAQVGISPLTAAGNLWDWRPQARVEQRFRFNGTSGLRAQGGLYMTYENDITLPAAVSATLEKWRPAFEVRVELYYKNGDHKYEVAPGFHLSSSHVSGTRVPSHIASLDWIAQPSKYAAFSGAWFKGQNTPNTGSDRQGFVVTSPGVATPIHSYGGWGQLAIFPAPRWTVNLYGGQQHDRAADLGNGFFTNGGITRNFTYAANFIYKLAPNILASFEASQNRTTYRFNGNRLNNHYDLSLAYLF